MISVVVPVYKALPFLEELAIRIHDVMVKINTKYELILVDDDCPENSWGIIERLSQSNPSIIGLKLLRNFGQHPAIIAGLNEAKGDFVVVMDCDLQDQPEEIIALYQKSKEGFEIVFARRHERSDGILKRMGSKFFYKAFSVLTGKKFDHTIGNFGMYSRKAVNCFLSLVESNKYLPLTMQWFGFKTGYVDVIHKARAHGKSSYSLMKLISLAAEMILSFSNRPLIMIIRFGAFVSILSFLAVIGVIIYKFSSDVLLGWSSIIITISFFSGIIITILGIIGLYVGRLVGESRKRPVFLIEKTTRHENA